jgi:hypothetical protein
MKNIFRRMSKRLLLAIVLSCLVIGTAIGLAAINLIYNMSAQTISRSLVIYSDAGGTNIIDPTSYVWSGQIIDNGSVIHAWTKNLGNVALTITITPVSALNCLVIYDPATAFVLTANETQEISMTFSNVQANSTATWSFGINAV